MNALFKYFVTLAMLVGAGCSLKQQRSLDPFIAEVENASQGRVAKEAAQESSMLYHYLLGNLALERQDIPEAINDYSIASELSGQADADLQSILAELYLGEGDVEKAEAALAGLPPEERGSTGLAMLHGSVLEAAGKFDQATEIFTEFTKNPFAPRDAYLFVAVAKGEEPGGMESALAVTNQGLARYSGDELLQFYRARFLEGSNRMNEAFEQYQKLYKSDPSRAFAAADAIRVLLKQQAVDKARQFAESARKLSPGNGYLDNLHARLEAGDSPAAIIQGLEALEVGDARSDCRLRVALDYVAKQKLAPALQQLRLLLARVPEHAEARYYLATLLAGSGSRDEAIRQLRKIDVKDSLFVKSRTLAAFIARQEGELEIAERSIRDALEREPENQTILLYLVVVLRDLGRHSEAEEVLSEAIEKDPSNDRLLFNYGLVLHDLNREPEAIATMERIITINPAHSDALNYVAYALSDNGKDLERAKALVDEALKVRPNDGYYLDTLGWVLYKQGKLAEAEDVLGRANLLAGDDAVVCEHLVEVFVQSNKLEKAVSRLKGCLEQIVEEDQDEEKRDSLQRMKRLLEKLIRDNPHLEGVTKNENVVSPSR